MEKKYPFGLKYLVLISALALTIYIVILLKSIVVPILLALILSLLLKPLAAWMESKSIHRILSSVLCILLFAVMVLGLFTFFSLQAKTITDDMKSIEQNIQQIADDAHLWAENQFGIKTSEQNEYLKDSAKKMMQSSSNFFGKTISATAGFFTGLVLFILSLFFFLYYRNFYKAFLFKVFSEKNHTTLHDVIHKTEKVVRKYLLGLGTVIAIIAVLNSVGLLIIGIDHAIFFGVLAAVLTIIPYVGVLAGSMLPVLFALVTKDSLWYPVGVAIMFWLIQFLEGNFITPNIVGNSVRVNPYAIILGLFLGGMALGPSGMILAIPLLAIGKVIFDNTPQLNSIGFLIGEPPAEK